MEGVTKINQIKKPLHYTTRKGVPLSEAFGWFMRRVGELTSVTVILFVGSMLLRLDVRPR